MVLGRNEVEFTRIWSNSLGWSFFGNKVPLQVAIQGALRTHKMMTLEEIERVALGCNPIPSKKEVEATLQKLRDGQWIIECRDDMYGEYGETIKPTVLKLEPNSQTKTALAAIRKTNWGHAR